MASDTAPPRLIALQGATNFRDLGGYPAAGGRRVRWRRLFRSDHLGELTPADRAMLARLGIARSLDFRGVAERAAVPYAIDGLAQHSLAIEPSVLQRAKDVVAAGQALTAQRMAALMEDLYRSLVNERSERFAEFFGHLLEADGPLVFHCTAGKDRTGLAAALLLWALGVPAPEVERDYLLTNEVFRHPPLPPGDPQNETPPEARAVLWSVQPGFLRAAWRAIEHDHGGLDRYLATRLRVGPVQRAALAARYLEPR